MLLYSEVTTKIVSNPSGKSAVWKVFGFYEIEKKVVNEKVVCRICHADYKYFGGN